MLFISKKGTEWRKEFIFFPKQVGVTPEGQRIMAYLCFVESRDVVWDPKVDDARQSYKRIEYRIPGSNQSHVNHVQTLTSSYI